MRTALHRLSGVGLVVLIITLVASAWGSTGAATGDIPMRIFMIGFAAGAVIISSGLRGKQRKPSPTLSLNAHHVTMGIVIGLAVGTTDWTNLQLAGWWQLWWTVPLLTIYVFNMVATHRQAPRNEP